MYYILVMTCQLFFFYPQEQEVQFKNLRVADPSKLLVNGEALKTDKLAPSAVTVTAFS